MKMGVIKIIRNRDIYRVRKSDEMIIQQIFDIGAVFLISPGRRRQHIQKIS